MKRLIVAILCAALLAMSCAALAEGESLWGKSVKAEMAAPPAKAFDKALEAPYIAGISADGQKLLIAGFGCSPYLWDRNSGERLYLTPGNDFTDEQLTLNQLGVIGKQPEGQREAFRERLEKMYANAPGDARLAMLMDRSLNLARGLIAQGACGDYMRLSQYNMSLSGLLDCRDGKWYCPEQGTPSLPVIDGKCVVTSVTGAALWDVEGGGMTEIDFGLPGWTVMCARLLPDGSVCGVLEDRTAGFDKVNGQENALVIVAPDGAREEYALGRRRLGQGFDMLMASGDGRRVVGLCSMAVKQDRPILIDRDAGQVSIAVAPLRQSAGATSPGESSGFQPGAAGACPSGSSAGAYLLTRQQIEQMRAIPLADCLDENGVAVLSDEDASCTWFPMAEMRDGTLLAMDMSRAELLLIDLRTLELDVLLDEKALMDLSEYRMALLGSPLPLTGDGLDSFALRSQDKYLHLTEGGGSLLDMLFGK